MKTKSQKQSESKYLDLKCPTLGYEIIRVTACANQFLAIISITPRAIFVLIAQKDARCWDAQRLFFDLIIFKNGLFFKDVFLIKCHRVSDLGVSQVFIVYDFWWAFYINKGLYFYVLGRFCDILKIEPIQVIQIHTKSNFQLFVMLLFFVKIRFPFYMTCTMIKRIFSWKEIWISSTICFLLTSKEKVDFWLYL